jgi:hypothetical protein
LAFNPLLQVESPNEPAFQARLKVKTRLVRVFLCLAIHVYRLTAVRAPDKSSKTIKAIQTQYFANLS